MANKDKLIKTTALVTAVIVLSKVFGLARDVLTAGYFGTGMENDAYQSAYTLFYLPVLLFNSCITATMVPLYTEEREKYSLEHSNRFASNALNLFMLAALLITIVMTAAARPLVSLVYSFSPKGQTLTVELTRIMMAGLVFNVCSIVLSSLLNAAENFIAAQLTGFPLSICIMIAAIFFSPTYGIRAIAWGVFAASVSQALVQIPFMRGFFKYSFRFDFKDKRFHKLLRLAGPAILSMGISEVNHLIDRGLASGLATGSISAMSYAYKLITFLLGILMVPLTTIMFSRMSRLAAEDDKNSLVASLKRSITLILMVALPIISIALVMSRDVVTLIYMRGQFTEESVAITSSVLSFYLVGVPAFGLRDLLNRTYHSLQDTKTPFRVSCLVVTLNIILNLILRHFMGANGLALATSIASYCGLTALLIHLRKPLGALHVRTVLRELVKIIAASMVAACVCLVLSRVLPSGTDTLTALLRLVVTTAAAFIAYIAACFVLRLQALHQFTDTVKSRIRK